jgi:predicted O-linked N-acetylglucosamine transferase (SPINDLY family)
MIGEVFSDAVNRAIEKRLSGVELIGIAGQLAAAGEHNLVFALYRVWLEHNKGDALVPAIYFNYGVCLSNANDVAGARDALKNAIQANPDFYPPYINLGTALERLGATGEAVVQWYTLINRLSGITGENIGYRTTALKQVGRVLERANYDEQAEESLRLGLDINSDQPDVIQHWLSLRQRQCKWPVVKPWGRPERQQLLNGFSALTLMAYTDDPLLQLANAHRYSKNNIGEPPMSMREFHRGRRKAPGERLKIGYLSSDLREHAIGYLTSEVFGLHDRSKVEVFLYYCGFKTADSMHERFKTQGDHWIDIDGVKDEDAARRIVDDGIDILVDINGYTNFARTKMLAMQPAPIIVNWLGFPGSMGTPYHNYIIADDFIIPPEHEIYYSERVMRLPCYQPNNRGRVISPQTISRQEAGLPEGAVVYCCFNGHHKITRFTWARWMSILERVPGSVLWLLDGIPTTNARLRSHAAEHGIAPERIIFAAKMANAYHLARYPLADLFLDTTPYGAHTTSSDALWMGVPVVTLAGRCFASRVCGSLIKSAGLPELVCTTPSAFIDLAVALGHDPGRRAELRHRLRANRDTCVLFDTPRLVARLEDLYARMWQDYVRGQLALPDLINLDVYADIGNTLDKDDVELMTVADYHGLYRQKLAEKDAFWHLPADRRLWSADAKIAKSA